MPSWLSRYPIEEETKDWDPTKPVFVDVGGGFGHKCLEFKTEKPNIPGRVILQDLNHSIQNALPMKDVELEVHDFFTPQTIKGLSTHTSYLEREIDEDYRSKVLLYAEHSPRLPG